MEHDNIKLYIVEDENVCREDIVKMPWDKIGVTVVGSAADGDEALEGIKKERPNVVISDINIPGYTGIELARKLHTLMPDVKIIFLTAYSNFDYAKQAITYEVFDYILKPVNSQKLIDTVAKAAEKIINEQKQMTDLHKLNTHLEKSKYFLQSYFFTAMNTKVRDEETIKIFGITADVTMFVSIVIAFNPENEESPVNYFNIFKQINKVITTDKFIIVPFYDYFTFTYVFAFKELSSKIDTLNETLKAAGKIQEYLEFNVQERFTIGVGEIVNGFGKIEFSHKRACQAIKYQFHLGYNKIIYINDIEPSSSASDYKVIIDEKLLGFVKIGDENSADKIISYIFSDFRRHKTDIECVQRACLEIIISISTTMAQIGQNPNVLFNKTELWSVLKNHKTVESLQKLISDIVAVAITKINFSRDTKNKEIIDKVKNIINENYQSELLLNDVAKQVHVSSCYLSVIFSNEANITFKNYLIQTRIEKAKEMLENSDLNIYEIASMVGYKSQKYFSFLFHRETGLMPTEYRAKHKL